MNEREMAAAEAAVRPWWGRFAVGPGEGGHWRVGPLELWVRRREREWRVAWSAADRDSAALEVRCPIALEELPQEGNVARFAMQATTPVLQVLPGMPDRPVVARPETAFHLLPGELVTFFVGTPVWLRLLVEDGRQLTEVPTQRLPDTWFGPSTMVGELCYASRTTARLHLDKLPLRAELAVTRVTLHNRAADALLLERLNLPVPGLGLWWHPERGLWTEGVAVEREPDGSLAALRVAEGPPEEVRGAERVAGARTGDARPTLVRALEALLG